MPLSSDGARTSSLEKQYEGEDDPAALETAKFMKALVDYKLGNGECLTTEIQQMVWQRCTTMAHMQPLWELITQHKFTIQAEQEELATGREGDRRLKLQH